MQAGSRGLAGRVIRGLYAITPEASDTAALLDRVRQALSGGVRVLQYRNKQGPASLRLEQANELRRLTRAFAVPLIVNDDARLACEVDADGVHLGFEDGSVAAARAIVGQGRIVGVSCYNRLELAREAEELGADYVAFGAFFASTVKPGAPVATLALLQQARVELALPVVAIGGITAENAGPVIAAGAGALAVISALFDAPDIALAARRFAQFSYSDQEDAT